MARSAAVAPPRSGAASVGRYPQRVDAGSHAAGLRVDDLARCHLRIHPERLGGRCRQRRASAAEAQHDPPLLGKRPRDRSEQRPRCWRAQRIEEWSAALVQVGQRVRRLLQQGRALDPQAALLLGEARWRRRRWRRRRRRWRRRRSRA